MDREDLLSRMSNDVKMHVDNVMNVYNVRFAGLMGIEIVSVSNEEVVCEMDLRPDQLNYMGFGHGGAIFSLVDHTFGIQCNIMHPCTGQNITINFYRPAKGRLRAVSRPINRSRSLEVYEVRVLSEEGKLVASAVCTAFVLKR